MTNTTRAINNNPKPLAYYLQDGLADFFIGWVAFLGGVGFMADLVYLGGIAPAIFLPIWQEVRQKVTQPRLGKLEMPRPALNLLTVTILLGLFCLLGVYAIGQFAEPDLVAWLRTYSLIAIGITLAGLLAGIGAFLGIHRLVAYSGLLLVLFLAGFKLNLEFGWILIAFGLFLMGSGSILFIRFIQDFPVRD